MEQYTYKGKTYTSIKEVQMKDPTTRDWHTAILYIGEPVDGVTPTYVREKSDFLEKFKLVK